MRHALVIRVQLFYLMICTLTISACSHSKDCNGPKLSDSQVKAIVEAYFEHEGHRLDSKRDAVFKVSRDECDYIYLETAKPMSPGGHFMVRVSKEGSVMKITHGN
jgi:hypothetical protein